MHKGPPIFFTLAIVAAFAKASAAEEWAPKTVIVGPDGQYVLTVIGSAYSKQTSWSAECELLGHTMPLLPSRTQAYASPPDRGSYSYIAFYKAAKLRARDPSKLPATLEPTVAEAVLFSMRARVGENKLETRMSGLPIRYTYGDEYWVEDPSAWLDSILLCDFTKVGATFGTALSSAAAPIRGLAVGMLLEWHFSYLRVVTDVPDYSAAVYSSRECGDAGNCKPFLDLVSKSLATVRLLWPHADRVREPHPR